MKLMRTKLTDKQIYLVLIALLIVMGIIGIAAQYSASNGTITEEQSLEIARKAVLSSPTYIFDGYELQHSRTVAWDCPGCWKFRFRFTSSHAGYGDRAGETLAQVITPHTAFIMVENGEIVSAELDLQWNMMTQDYIKIPTQTPDEQPPEDTNDYVPNVTNDTAGEVPVIPDGAPVINDTQGPVEGFCGSDTGASCNSDAGCKASGCSNHVCISLSQFSVTTTCEWRDCYNASAYDLQCRCVDNLCQWAE